MYNLPVFAQQSPTPETLDGVVEALSPVHVVITHQQGAAANQYNDKYDSFIWATDNTDCDTLLDETSWTPSPWVTKSTTCRVQAGTNTSGRLLGGAVDDVEMPLPSVTRVDDVDLGAEGLDLERLRDRFLTGRVGQTPNGARDDQQGADGSTAATDRVRADGTPGEWPDTTDEPDIETALTSIDARLDRIETAVTERRIGARVVDAGDDTLLLRLDNPPAHLKHGQRLRVLLQDGLVPENAAGQLDRES